jgi:hypothetical protein
MTLSPHVVSECVVMFENCILKIENLSGLYIPEIVLGNGFGQKSDVSNEPFTTPLLLTVSGLSD